MKRIHRHLNTLRQLWLPGLAVGLAMTMSVASAEEEEAVPLPAVEDLAALLADAGTHNAALLAVAALAGQHPGRNGPGADGAGGQAERLLRDHGWLDSLQTRFGAARPRSPVLDPAAWRLRVRMEQHALEAGAMYSGLGPAREVLGAQVFNRGNPHLAAAALPELLWHMEAGATVVLDDWLRQAESDAVIVATLASFGGLLPEPVVNEADLPGIPPSDELFEWVTGSLTTLANEAAGVGPPDPRRLRDLRYRLLTSMHLLATPDRQAAGIALHLAGLLNDLGEHRYFHFVEGLLGSVSQLDQLARLHPGQVDWLARALVDLLPGISSRYSRGFAGVDPRLNSAFAAAFDGLRNLERLDGSEALTSSTPQLADAVAKLALLVPDMDFYFDLPVRDPVAGVVDACTGIVASRDPDGSPAMTRELFDDCQQSLLELAEEEAREAQLAGDPDGPFGENNLQRELSLVHGQRINYTIGYLHDRYTTGCEPPGQPLPNPLEWAFLATFMAWFAEQSPVYFQTPENERRLMLMRDLGLDLVRVLTEQVDCFTGVGAGVDDPVSRVTEDYRRELLELSAGLRNAEAEFRAQFLAPGADVALDGKSDQSTAYRPDNLVIGPCDPDRVCEMSGELSSTRALLGLFPDPYLLADQTGLGRIQICYDSMEWVDRRAEPVRSGDENVANYFGHLAFDLKGRFLSQGDPVDLFAFRFRAPEEQHYMFAAAAEEALNDSCPVEWFGARIVTTLPEGRRGIVPNRLTYLSAPRTLPSWLLSRNWDRGAEWRDWFVTGIGVDDLPVPPRADLFRSVNQHLQSLYRLEQQALYGILMQASPNPDFESLTPLFDAMARLGVRKALIRSQMMLFYPHTLNESDVFRSAVAGYGGLLDTQVLDRFREDNVPVAQVADIAHDRLERFQERWRAQPESIRRGGSVTPTLSHALIRLNALYERYFTAPAEPPPLVRDAGQ